MNTSKQKNGTRKTGYRRKSALQRRQELIDAGIHCLNMGGMSAFTIDNIHKQAAVSRGMINHHFRGKEELLLCVYENMTDYLLEQHETKSPAEQVIALIESNFDDAGSKQSNLRAWLAIWGEVATNPVLRSLHRDRYGAYKQSVRDAIQAIITQRRLKLDANAVARQLIALIDGLWLEYCLHSDSFMLSDARSDCYRFLESQLEIPLFDF